MPPRSAEIARGGPLAALARPVHSSAIGTQNCRPCDGLPTIPTYMSAIEVVVRTPKPPEGLPGPSPLKGVLDLVVDGVNVTARLGEGPALLLLAELASGVALLSRGRRDRTT